MYQGRMQSETCYKDIVFLDPWTLKSGWIGGRYFLCEFVREIYINELNKETSVCILKCKVIPSQYINSKPYDVWAVVQKNKPNEPGGYINSAYCTCKAGILGTCNHVTGMLFRIGSAVQTGITTSSKTSVLCT